jgi:benzoyl-CoA reductase subunit D
MIQVGIDVGAKFIKALVLKDGNVIAKEQISTGFESKENAAKLFDQVLQKAGISHDDVNSITSTGSGRKVVDFATKSITDVTAASKGATNLYPEVQTVIDVGAEEGRSIRCNKDGKIVDFAINEKCAAGAGSFTEASCFC